MKKLNTKTIEDLMLATTESVTTTYAGQYAGGWIQGALLSGPTLGNKNVTVKENILKKEVIKKLASASIIQAAACDYTPTGTFTVTEAVLEPTPLMVNVTLCKKSYVGDWITQGYGLNDELDTTYADFIIANISKTVGAAIETAIWAGSGATTTSFPGIMQRLYASSDVVKVTGATVASTAIAADLEKMLNALPAAVYGSPDLTFYMAADQYRAYIMSLNGFGASGLGGSGYKGEGGMWYNGQPLYFSGVKCVLAPGLTSGNVILAESTNIFFGTNVLDDTNAVKVIDQSNIDGSDNIHFIMKFTAGTQIGYTSEVVWLVGTASHNTYK